MTCIFGVAEASLVAMAIQVHSLDAKIRNIIQIIIFLMVLSSLHGKKQEGVGNNMEK